MGKIINIGVLGCANIAQRSVIPTIINLNNYFNLAGIASRNFDNALDFGKQFNTIAFKGYQSLIESNKIQAVYIPLPNSLHAEWIEAALDRGLHVLAEKSLACEYDDVVKLNELAKKKSLALVENFQFRFHSQIAYIIELLNSGKIGDLRCLRSSFGFPVLPNENDIRYQKSLGGGALLDAGAYPIKIAQIFLGADITVKASTLCYLAGKEVDFFGGAYLENKKHNLFGEIAFGFDNMYQCSLELWGSKGRIFTNRIFTANPNHEPIIELENRMGKETIILPSDDHFKNMLIHFYELVNNKTFLNDEYSQNINQARLIHEIKLLANE